MDEETNPLAELPAEVREEMTPGERLAYLAYLEEPCPAEAADPRPRRRDPATPSSFPASRSRNCRTAGQARSTACHAWAVSLNRPEPPLRCFLHDHGNAIIQWRGFA
ncbi:hypothetical protein ACQP25_01760 [Microtetraspora malaysiensis]|uniref:hypothetical protein n=1 Tax=Microtetraspora malaysiensis TaxID=161358 RepID=UPI003D910D9C